MHSAIEAYVSGMYGGVFPLQGGEFQRPWKRCSIIAKWPLEVEIAMGTVPMPISVSSGHFALRYEVPKFLARGGHLCMPMAMLKQQYKHAGPPRCIWAERGARAAAGAGRAPGGAAGLQPNQKPTAQRSRED